MDPRLAARRRWWCLVTGQPAVVRARRGPTEYLRACEQAAQQAPALPPGTADTCAPAPAAVVDADWPGGRGGCAVTARDRAILRAVRVGRAELVCGCEPHLLVDGLNVCDQDTQALAGLIAPAIPGLPGMRVLAVLTDAGRQALAGAGAVVVSS